MVAIKKKGLQHIEAILAFVLFIGFLIFVFFFLSPFKGSRTLTSSLDYAFNEVVSNSESEVESYVVVVDRDVTKTGYIGVSINRILSGPNINAKAYNKDGSPLSTKLEDNNIYFIRGTKEERVFTIRFSDALPNSDDITGDLLDDDDYLISSSDETKMISESKFRNIQYRYDNDYENLKREFNIPNRVDFGFSLIFDDGVNKITAEKEIRGNTEVLSKSDRVQVIIANSGEIKFAEMIIKVW